MATELLLLKDDYQRRVGLPRVLGEDPAWKETLRRCSGPGRARHRAAAGGKRDRQGAPEPRRAPALGRAKGPFVAINCAAIPENLLENELFGHEKARFTGATSRKTGKAELAQKGTLFSTRRRPPAESAGQILRLVQERQFERVGGVQTISVDVRLVAARTAT
jgi:hypothetical protein